MQDSSLLIFAFTYCSFKLKQKTGMAEKTSDAEFETTKQMLNDLIENATGICKAFVKHAEALEG